MRVAITGHTRGIGKALTEVFDDVVGFSKSTGYDINNKEDRLRIINESQDCDVFINNAYSGFSQTELLFDLWQCWKNEPKIIVNLGSVAADYSHAKYRLYMYATHKVALEYASLQMTLCKEPCKVICVKPSYVETEAIKNIMEKKIATADLANQIKEIVTMKTTFWVPSMTLYPN